MNAKEIKELRDKLGISQERLAEMLGVSSRTIQNWEAGGTIPQTKELALQSIGLNPDIKFFGGGQSNVNGDNIAGGNIKVETPKSQDKWIELLMSKELSLQKAQDHITELLDIIKSMQRNG